MNNTAQRRFWSRLKFKHERNIKKGVYGYMWKTAYKIILVYLVIMIPALLIGHYLLDFNAIFDFITTRFQDWVVLTFFFISEIFLGMIPPDFFVIWSTKFSSPLLFLSILGVLSYAGGAVAYYIGYLLLKRERIKTWSERVLSKYIGMVRKWGGAFIVISALFPFSPFSIVVIAVSLFKYPFKLYLLYGIVRIARFLIQGLFYINMIDIESILG
jgi:membrane protein YqaA with SNARE-associated domain